MLVRLKSELGKNDAFLLRLQWSYPIITGVEMGIFEEIRTSRVGLVYEATITP